MEIEGKKCVPGIGSKRPKLILIGEAPGEEEEKQRIPFVGTDGKILDGILNSARLHREDLYLTNVVKVRAPESKIKNLPRLGLTIEEFIPFLKEELEKIDCKVCIPLGDVALNILCGKDGITKHRGSIYKSTLVDNLICVPTFNPGFIREFWQSRGTVVNDLLKAQRIALEGYHPVTFNTLTRPTLDQVEWFIDQLRSLPSFSFDIENMKKGGQILCLGLGGIFNGQRRSICIPFKRGYKNYWSHSDEIYVWGLVTTLFNLDALKIGQFISHDLTFLCPFIGEPAPPWFDTSVAHHTIDPELPHDLAYLTSIYTDVPYYKDDPKEEGESGGEMTSSEILWEYNGKDAEIPLILEPILTKEMAELGVLDFYRGFQMPLMRVMWRMQRRGMCVDERKKQELLADAYIKAEELQIKLEEKVGYPLNVNSPKQMMKFLYKDLGLPIQYQRKTRRPTADKETLEKLFSRYPNETFKVALDIRGITKEIGTYLNAKPSPDGKYRGRYNLCGTETGRSSCSKYYDGAGLDMQNVSRNEDIRGMFIPSEGKVFLMYDLWQAEAYCVAIFAKCQSFLSRLHEGKKVHSLVGSWLFKRPEEEIKAEGESYILYKLARSVTHACNYGLGWSLLTIYVNGVINEYNEKEKKAMSLFDAKRSKEVLAIYNSYAPEIGMWHREVQEELGRTRRLTTPFGRVRFFRNRFGEEMFREAYSHLPQSTIADYCHQAMLRLEYCLPKGAEMVQEGFDSVIIECLPEQTTEVDGIVREAFDKELFWRGEIFKIPVEGKEAKRWEK